MTHNNEHEVSNRTYTIVFVGLLALLALAVITAAFDLGRWNLPVSLGIAVANTVLIMLFFMLLVYSSPLIRVLAAGALLWLTILISLTFGDYVTRHWLSVQTPTIHPAALDRASESAGAPREEP
jgi:cytochrome c oxidase subunit 4